MLQALSHAFAKAAMFMAAGLIAEALGHDRIAELGGIGRALPMTVFAFGLGGLSLMGLPPSGGFAAKWLLLHGVGRERPVVVGAGHPGGRPARRRLRLPRARPGAGRAQASPSKRCRRPRASRGGGAGAGARSRCCSGFVPLRSFGLLQIGRPLGDGGSAMNGARHAGARLLLAATLAAPLVLLLACLSRRLRDGMPALLALAPLPGLAAALLAIGGTPLAFDAAAAAASRLALDVPGAMLLGAAALLWIAAGVYAFGLLARQAERRDASPCGGC